MSLSISQPPQQPYVIIQISDTHLMDRADLEFVRMNPEQSFHTVMQHILTHHPQIDAIIHTGDVAQVPVVETYARYQAYMQQLGIPFFQIPGNHDELSLFPFPSGESQPTAIESGNWCLILLNSAVKGRIDGHIKATDLQCLHDLLEQYADKHVIVACHHHPFAMQSHWIDQHKLKNSEDLTDVLARHSNVKAVLNGHVHQDAFTEWEGIQFLSAPSTCVQFKPFSQDFALDECEPGYRVLYLHQDGQFDSQVYRVKYQRTPTNAKISGY